MRGPTPSQTVGPFFRFGLAWLAGRDLVAEGHPGLLRLHGVVRDGEGDPVTDAVVEIWQADPAGKFPPRSPSGWRGFGRCLTGPDGGYSFATAKPGRVDGMQAPHIDISLFARGLLQRLVTRVYFPDEGPANSSDPVLTSLPDPSRAETLVGVPDGLGLRFDMCLQGPGETVFFAW